MVKKINFLLVLLLLIFISMASVCASDDLNETVSSNDAILDNSLSDEVLFSSDGDLLSEPVTYEISSDDYSTYFSSNGNLISSKVNSGDTIKLTGDWNNKEFKFNKTVNVVYSGSKTMKNCIFTFTNGANGSSIVGLKIANNKDYNYGIFLNGVINCTVKDCFINNTGMSSYAICIANEANYNNITNNVFNTYGITYGQGTRSTSPVLLCGAHHNYIANNQISCDDANAIYLSKFDGGPLKGGVSNYNLIYNNTIKYNVLPTSWAYGIQVMGGNNKIDSNIVIGAFRGIATTDGNYNEIINNKIVNVTGADYNNPNVVSGGEFAIVGSSYSIIANNTIVNANVLSGFAGIYAGTNVVVENNSIEIISSGYGIQAAGNNVTIKNNNVSTNLGAGVFLKGNFVELHVIGNNITSNSGVGVLITKESAKKMPGNVTIVDNYIATGNSYAINAGDIDSSTENTIEDNEIPKGKGNVVTPEGTYDPSKPKYIFNGAVYTVTPENYNDYFDVGGTLNPSVKNGDILSFEGNFINLGVIYVNAAIKLTGSNPTFTNTTFRLSDGVWIENFTIKNKNSERINAWGILVYNTCGAKILNCTIDVTDPNAAYAIYVVESSDVDVINNTLTSSGNYLTYTLLAISVEDCNFINNTIYTVGTGIEHGFESNHCVDGNSTCVDGNTNCADGNTVCTDGSCVDGSSCVGGDSVCTDGSTNCADGNSVCADGSVCTSGNTITGNHVLREVYRTYGILMTYSSGCNVSGNKVNVTSKLSKTASSTNSSVSGHNNLSTNSVVGIDLYYDSHNNVFSNNEVYIKANDTYIYGMGVLGYYTGHDAPEGQGATDNQFINNKIVLEGTYFVQGLVIGDSSESTIIIGNDVSAKSMNYSYGINLEMSQNSTIKDNAFTLNSDIVYGLEAFTSNNNIINGNKFDIKAKQAYGMVLSNAENNIILENIIMNNVTGEKITYRIYDSVGSGVAAVYIKSKSLNNVIRCNNFTSVKGYAVLVDDLAVNNEIADNYLMSEKGSGNAAINNSDSNNINGNYVYVFNGSFDEVSSKYLDTVNITVNVDVDGALVKFYIGDEEIGSTISSNGVATLKYKLGSDFDPATYKVNAIITKDNYLSNELSSTLYVGEGSLDVTFNDVSAYIGNKGKFIATVKDADGNPISGITVKFYKFQGRYVYVGMAKTDKNGVATLNAEVPTTIGSYKMLANISDDSNTFESSSKESSLTVTYKPAITLYKTSSVYYGNTIKYKVRIKDDTGKYAVAGKIVTIKVNGKSYSVKTDKGGYAYKSIALKAGSYTVSVQYKGISSSSKITFKPILIAKSITKKKAKTIKFSVKLVNKYGKILKYKKVTFKFKGKKYTAKTNKYGYATVSLKNLKVGKYAITSTYGGCTVSNKITIKK